MATVIDELWITLGLDGSKARGEFNNTINSMRSGLKSVTSLFTGFTAGLTGLFAIQSQFSDWKTKAIEIQNAARSVNRTMEEVQAWGMALGKYGGNMDSFTNAVRSLNGELVKMSATGVSRAGKILAEGYGVDVGDIGRLRAVDDVMGDIAEVMKGMSIDEAMGLGAKIGMDTSMVQVLRQGREAYKDLIEQKKKDAVYTEEDAKTVRDYNAAMKQVTIGVARISNVLFRLIVPAFTAVTRAVGDFVKYLSKHETAVKAFFVMLSGLIIGLLLPSIMAFFGALLTNPITWVIVLLAALALAIEDLVVWAQGGESALGDIWTSIFGSPEEAQEIYNQIVEGVEETWRRIQDVWDAFIENEQLVEIALMTLAGVITTYVVIALGELAAALLANPIFWVVAIIMAIVAAFLYWDEIVAWVSESIDSTLTALAEWIDSQFDSIEEWANECWQSICDKANEIVEAIKGFFIGLKDTIMAAIGEAVDWALGKLASLASAIASLPVIGGAVDYVMGGSGGSSSTVNTKIGQITVNTQATDANGIASSMGGAVNRKFNPYMANGGVIQ